MDIFTRPKRTKEIKIDLNNECFIGITEHQLGRTLDKPEIFIGTGLCTYSMDFDEFVKKIRS
jgi:hypothetical protein